MPFVWDPVEGRYRTPDGRLVREDAVRRALDAVIAAQPLTMRAATQALVDGQLSLADWTLQMMAGIKSVHLVGLATAHGGWNQLGQDDFGWVGQRIRSQYGFLMKFSVEVSSGKQKLDGTAVARSALYAQAARETHREAQRRLARQRFMSEERRVLGAADHCRDCLQQAGLGWQPFGTLRRIGESACRANCRCHFAFRMVA